MDVIMMRLDKFLSEMGVGTRSELKKAIRAGAVQIDGRTALRPEEKVEPEQQEITYQGKQIGYVQYEYYMLNKPAGVISATEDAAARTVLDLIGTKKRKDLFPVGRLDKDTEGLLLITNDGDLAHRLLSPKKHVDKVYFARIAGRVTEEDKEAFALGVDIGDEKLTLPAELQILCSGEVSEIKLTIQEGRFHQVKRMFEAVGKEVIYLKRLSMGQLVLDDSLAAGAYRELTKEELNLLC